MAPGGRPIKKNTRMAAALDAMRPYGYDDDLILKTVKQLLDVYGEENWYFIEECSYKVLLESILDQEEQQRKKELSRGETIYESSSGALALPSAEAEALNVALPTNEVADPTFLTDGNCEAPVVTHKPVMLLGGGSEDINLDKSSVKCLTASPHVNESKQPADVFPVRRRRPYHGWISDGEDEAELVDVEPPPHSEELQKVLFGRVVWKIRKTRWDLRPEDM